MQNNYIYHKQDEHQLPKALKDIDRPPKQIFFMGEDYSKLIVKPCVAIVGSRKPTPYGREVTTQITRELCANNVTIISGLAFGVDSIAHKVCIESGGKTIAVLPSALDQIYPKSHRGIAQDILKAGGSIITEYPESSPILKINFIARNRLISALSDVVVITEAAEKSGTLHTANFALAQGKTVMAVPGPISSQNSKGTNNLIKTGASPITEVKDILFELGHTPTENQSITAANSEEFIILQLLKDGVRNGHELLAQSNLTPPIFNQTITMLEINGKVAALGNNQWSLT